MINEMSEVIVACGAIISDIPLIDKVRMKDLKNAKRIRIEWDTIDILE
jgi:predicted aconitase with swiveling domain